MSWSDFLSTLETGYAVKVVRNKTGDWILERDLTDESVAVPVVVPDDRLRKIHPDHMGSILRRLFIPIEDFEEDE